MIQRDRQFVKKIELAVNFGKKILLTNYSKDILELRKLTKGDTQFRMGQRQIFISKQEVEYNQQFQMMLFTDNTQQIRDAYLNVVNYSVSETSLKETLQNQIV